MTVSLQASPAEEAEADAVPVKEEEEANAADLMMSSEKAPSMEPALEDDEDTNDALETPAATAMDTSSAQQVHPCNKTVLCSISLYLYGFHLALKASYSFLV